MRYYSIHRPVMPGSYPAWAAVKEIVNFGRRIYCEEIDWEAWGYIDVADPLPEDEARKWELVPEGILWYAVTVGSQKHGGGLTASIQPDPVTAKKRPADSREETESMQFKTRYFKGYDEAERVCGILNSLTVTTERVRMSATQGECKVFINGTYIMNFGDHIVLPEQDGDPKNYYGADVGGWRSSEPDSAFVLGPIWHPFDFAYHYSDDVCRKLGISRDDWIEGTE